MPAPAVALKKKQRLVAVDLRCDSPGHILSSYGSLPGLEAQAKMAEGEGAPVLKIAAAVLGYGALSIGMTLLFKRALSLFAYPCILVAATFVFEAAAVRAASGPASGLDDGNGRPLFLIACCVGGEVALSNSGLMLLSVAAHTMIKACTPVFVLCAAMFLKLEAASLEAVVIVVLISVGTALCSFGRRDVEETERAALSQALGAALTICAGAVGGLRWGLTQLATQKAATKVEPRQLVARTLPSSAGFLVAVALVLDVPRAAENGRPARFWADAAHVLGLALLLALGGLALLRVEVALVAMTSSLSLSIAAVAKELLLVVVSVAALGDSITVLNAVGFALTGCGVVAYNVHKCAQRQRQQHADHLHATPPHSTSLLRRAYHRVPISADDPADDDDAAAPSVGLPEAPKRADSLPA